MTLALGILLWPTIPASSSESNICLINQTNNYSLLSFCNSMSPLSTPSGHKDPNEDDDYRVWKMYIISEIIHGLNTSKNIQDVAMTCSYNWYAVIIR